MMLFMHRHRAIFGSYVRHGRGGYVRSRGLVPVYKKGRAVGAVSGADLSPPCARAIAPLSDFELRKMLILRRARQRSNQPYGRTAPSSMRDRPDPADGHGWGKLRVDPALEAKAGTDRAYREFISAVASACASPEAKSLDVADFAISEARDLECPRWLKLILRVDFVGGGFSSKRARRIRLREIVNKRISSAMDKPEVHDRIDEMMGRFFIIASW